MVTLNLIDAATSGIKYKLVTFPDGQPHIKLETENIQPGHTCRIITRLASPADLLLALYANNTLLYCGFDKTELHVSYLMSARMDRVMTNGEPFSLKVIATILNAAGFSKIKIFDPHSEVCTALLDKSFAIDNIEFVRDAMADYRRKNSNADLSRHCIVSPDAGALKKIHKVAAALDDIDVVECMKERDVKTGVLSGFKVFKESLAGKTCFIIDDICDGGGTFIGVAKALKDLGAEKTILVVSHGIFSRGIDIQHVDEAYCTNSFKEFEVDNKHFNVFPVLKYLA